MMSAHPKAQELANQYQIDDFLAKPFNKNDLLNKLKIFLNIESNRAISVV
ncbi:MAG: hypothetical protein SFU25_11780 [Candidatus Caenarcaniphilales bacterium]|nr:hypothetical protein [Candidatus Caenarcaniphilales bacterium]